jgi:DNA-binding XRE family transcriptional regulator
MSNLRFRRKTADPTEEERSRRPRRLVPLRPRAPRPGLYQFELAQRVGVSMNTIVDIEKGRLTVTQETLEVIERGCESPLVVRPAVLRPDLEGIRLAAGVSIGAIQGEIATIDGQPLHKDTLKDVEHGNVQITEEFYQTITAAIERAAASRTSVTQEVAA